MIQIDRKDTEMLHRRIGEAGKITVVSHSHPDGDAAGCCIAMLSYLLESGKDAMIALPDPTPAVLGFMFSEEYRLRTLIHSNDRDKTEKRISGSDLIICVDFNALHRTGDMEKALAASKAAKVLIDHHLDPDTDSFSLCFSQTEISSASELLFHLLKQMPGIDGDVSRLPLRAAEALLTGMTTDTNNFANSVFPSTFSMASELLAAGADRENILSHLYNEFRENRLRAMGRLLDSEMTITGKGVAYMIMDRHLLEKFETENGETEGFVNLPLSIGKVRMSIFLKEEGEYFRVSVRAKKGTSANMCAKTYFNGGGHELAAGGKLHIGEEVGSAEEAAKYIERVTDEFLD